MAVRRPPFLHLDLSYLRAVVERPQRTGWAHLARGLLQLPRLALLFGLCSITTGMISSLWLGLRSFLSFDAHLDRTTFGMALWTWGAAVLVVELCVLAVRDAAAAPWPGSVPSTGGLLIRALGGAALVAAIEAMRLSAPTTVMLELSLAYPIFAWSLPSALRGVFSTRLGLRSLAIQGGPITPGRLAIERGKLGRRLVAGRLDAGDGVLSLSGDGEIARLDARELAGLIRLDEPPGRPMILVAEAHVDDGGYRSGGVRLASGELPVWLLAADGVEGRLAGFRSRLRLAALLDGAYVAAVLVGTGLFASYMGLALIARI